VVIENSMVIDSLWRHQEPKEIAECPGCGEMIYAGQEVLDLNGEYIHRDIECTYQYVAGMSVSKVAGEGIE
jgi:hypothetical protein